MRALRDCKQRSLTVSKTAPTVSKKLPPLLPGASRDMPGMKKTGSRESLRRSLISVSALGAQGSVKAVIGL